MLRITPQAERPYFDPAAGAGAGTSNQPPSSAGQAKTKDEEGSDTTK